MAPFPCSASRWFPVAALLVLTASGGQTAESAATDCLGGVKNSHDAILSADLTCADGNPACDDDGQVNGSCTFKLSMCVNIPDVKGCLLQSIRKAKGIALKLPQPGAKKKLTVTPSGASSVCGPLTDVVVKLGGRGAKKGTKPGRWRVVANASAGKPKDKDAFVLTCTPPVVECGTNPAGGPNLLTLVVGPGGGDLDTGFSGKSHNFINVPNSTLKYCLSDCDGTTDTTCHGSGPTGPGSPNGLAFGPPLPLFSSNVAVCVVNRFKDATIQAEVDLASGAFDATATPLNLLADTYQGSPTAVCPRCVQGRCDGGRNQGGACTVGGTVIVNNPPSINNVAYPVSADCLPSTSNLLGTPNVALNLTSGTSVLPATPSQSIPCPGQAKHDECGTASCTEDCSARPDSKGGVNQTCCTNAQHTPCFPTDLAETGVGQIIRTGNVTAPTPALPDTTYPKTNQGTLAATFCIDATGSITVDGTAGLAGPGALLLPGIGTFTK